MNWYFYKVWLPLTAATLFGFFQALVGQLSINWPLALSMAFLVGPVGVGVGFHRLFSHRAFETWKPVEYTLAVLGTLSAYAPVLFWAANHQNHHGVADYPEDPSSPLQHGALESYFTYRMRSSVLKDVNIRNGPVRRIFRDKFLMGLSREKNYLAVLGLWTIVLLLAGRLSCS